DFLVKEGFDVESKPSTKLSPDMYAVLLKEFQGDKIVKDEAKQIVIGKIRRDESAVGTGGANPMESREDIQEEDDTPSKEVLVKDTGSAPAAASTPPVQDEPVSKDKKEERSSPFKVVGKIDLDDLKRGKPKKESEKVLKKEDAP